MDYGDNHPPQNLLRSTQYNIMARKSSGIFFLRKTVAADKDAAFTQDSIDISSFVNLTQGECLRIRNIWFEWTDTDNQSLDGANVGANGTAKGVSCAGQVTTDSKTAVHSFGSTGMVAKNDIYAHIGASTDLDFVQQSTGLNPYDFEDGYIVATDAIYFGTIMPDTAAYRFLTNINMTCLLECETVRLSKEDATALLVGQTLG